jgi:hypothetical protein
MLIVNNGGTLSQISIANALVTLIGPTGATGGTGATGPSGPTGGL